MHVSVLKVKSEPSVVKAQELNQCQSPRATEICLECQHRPHCHEHIAIIIIVGLFLLGCTFKVQTHIGPSDLPQHSIAEPNGFENMCVSQRVQNLNTRMSFLCWVQ